MPNGMYENGLTTEDMRYIYIDICSLRLNECVEERESVIQLLNSRSVFRMDPRCGLLSTPDGPEIMYDFIHHHDQLGITQYQTQTQTVL